jgi:hypothetical protein
MRMKTKVIKHGGTYEGLLKHSLDAVLKEARVFKGDGVTLRISVGVMTQLFAQLIGVESPVYGFVDEVKLFGQE